MKPIKIKVSLDTSALKTAEAEGKKVAQSFEKGLKPAEQASNRLTQTQLDGLRKLEAAKQKLDAANAQRQTGAERRAQLHQQRLELIVQRSAARLSEIEARKAAQIEATRERAFRQEQARLKKLEQQQSQTARASLGTAVSGLGFAGSLAAGGVAYGAISKAFDADALRTQLTSMLGSVDKANAKILEFRKIARETPGVLASGLTEAFSQLRLISGITDATATKFALAVNRIKALFPAVQDVRGFSLNLSQIYEQNFELSDVKQVRGVAPGLFESIQRRLGAANLETLRELKKQGKLSAETYAQAFIDEMTARAGSIQETLQLRMVKALEETNIKLAELGDRVLKQFLPVLDKLLPAINSVLGIFSKLPDWLQASVVGFAALGTPIIAAATAIGKLTAAVLGLNSASAAGGLARIAAFFGTPVGAGLGVAGLGGAGLGLGFYEANRRLGNLDAQFKNDIDRQTYRRQWGFDMPIDTAERARKEAEVMALNNALEFGGGIMGKVQMSVRATPLLPDKPLLDLSGGSKKTGSGVSEAAKRQKEYQQKIEALQRKIEEGRREYWEDAVQDLDKLNNELRQGLIDDKVKAKADEAFRATRLIEQRETRRRLTREADERAVEALQRSARRTYNRAGDFLDDALNRGQLTAGEAETLSQGNARAYANRLREVLEIKSKMVGVDDAILNDLRDEANYYDRLGTSIDSASRFMKGFNSQIQSTGDIFERFGQNVSQAFGNISTLFDSLKNSVRQFFNDLLGRSLQNLLRTTLTPLVGRLGGLFGNPAAATAGGLGNIAFGGLGGGTFGGSVFNQPSATGIFANGQFAAGLASAARNGATGIFANGQFARGLSGSGVRPPIPAFNFSNFGKSFAAAAPFLGLSIGSSLGGQSIAGQILGGAGGLAIGGFAAASAGLLGTGTAAALFSNPITAIAGAALLVGGIFLGRAKQRRADEKLADTYWVQYGEVLDRLTRDVRANRIDGESALAQAYAARQQAIDQINTIKTKSVRESRLKNQIADVDRLKLEPLKRAVEEQKNRRDFDSRLIPEFATGGRVPGDPRQKRLVIAHGEELIINSRQQTPELIEAARNAGVPGIGGSKPGGNSPAQNLHVEVLLGTETQDQLLVNGLRRPAAFRVLVQQTNTARRYKEV